jgi:hypothetical protein
MLKNIIIILIILIIIYYIYTNYQENFYTIASFPAPDPTMLSQVKAQYADDVAVINNLSNFANSLNSGSPITINGNLSVPNSITIGNWQISNSPSNQLIFNHINYDGSISNVFKINSAGIITTTGQNAGILDIQDSINNYKSYSRSYTDPIDEFINLGWPKTRNGSQGFNKVLFINGSYLQAYDGLDSTGHMNRRFEDSYHNIQLCNSSGSCNFTP